MSGSSSGEPFQLEAWCQRELAKLLAFPVEEDLVSYLVSMETERDVEDYLEELLGKETRGVKPFMREFLRRWGRGSVVREEGGREVLQELVRPNQDELLLFAEKKTDSALPQKPPPGFEAASKGANPPPLGVTTNYSKRSKYIPLMSSEGQSRATVQLPGRHGCQCLAQKHALVNNCVECGRIVCSQEGSGPCLTCGALVCSPEEEELLARQSKKGLKFREKFLKKFQIKDEARALDHIQKVEGGEGEGGSLSSALEHKEKLLEFDQTSVSRTAVIDDEMDYFSVESNRWLSRGERGRLGEREGQLKEDRHGRKKKTTVTLDFAGRRVVEDNHKTEVYDEKHVEGLMDKKPSKRKKKPPDGAAMDRLYNPSIPVQPPKFVEPERKGKGRPLKSRAPVDGGARGGGGGGGAVRLQDRALLEMRDEGKCLSMHQPWASLLVGGVKRAEGRSWYTTHRGRLWIAAAAQQPTQEQIQQMEDSYRKLYNDEGLSFPSSYPTGCLLGCVDMVDCLPQEDYREQCPDGESESPFVFVVENPQELTVKFPIKGKHKIWKLESGVLAAARKGCQPVVLR